MRSTSIIGMVPPNLWDATPDQRHPLGTEIEAFDDAWGTCSFIYVSSAGAISAGNAVVWDGAYAAVVLPTTGNTGQPIGIAKSRFPAGTNFGWVQVKGIAPATFSAAATAGNVFGGTAGNLTPTAAAGRQILNAKTVRAATYNFTRSVGTRNGSTLLRVPDKTGLFVGLTVSGTNIPGSTTIASLDTGDNNTVLLNQAATGTGQVTGTFTHTGFGLVQLNHPTAQSQIT